MDYFKLMNDYVEGDLSHDRERELFSVLSTDDELRDSMRNLLRLKDFTKKAYKDVKPGNDTRAAVFAAAGFNPAHAPSASTGSGGAAAGGAFTKFRAGIASSIIASALTAFTILVIIPDSEQTETSERTESTPPKIEMSVPAAVPEIAETRNTKANTKNITAPQRSMSPVNVIPENDKYADQIASVERSKPGRSFIPAVLSLQAHDNTLHGIELENPGEPDLSTEYFLDGFMLELRKNESWFGQAEKIDPANKPFLYNYNLSVYYELSRNFYIGAGIGSENYYLTYSALEQDGFYKYEQQPILTSYEFKAMYKMPMDYVIAPYLQFSAGLNKIGSVARGTAGAAFELNDYISLLVAMDYTKIFYRHNEMPFDNHKWSINYGLQIKF